MRITRVGFRVLCGLLLLGHSCVCPKAESSRTDVRREATFGPRFANRSLAETFDVVSLNNGETVISRYFVKSNKWLAKVATSFLGSKGAGLILTLVASERGVALSVYVLWGSCQVTQCSKIPVEFRHGTKGLEVWAFA